MCMGVQWVPFIVTALLAAVAMVCPVSFCFPASQIKQQIVYFDFIFLIQ